MNTIERERMEKLIAFLDVLEPEKFNFDYTVRDWTPSHCGAVCCAMGWTPKIFPNEVAWTQSGVAMNTPRTDHHRGIGYDEVASELFGLSYLMAEDLFSPLGQSEIHADLAHMGFDATPQDVAAMLRKFLELLYAGQIEL